MHNLYFPTQKPTKVIPYHWRVSILRGLRLNCFDCPGCLWLSSSGQSIDCGQGVTVRTEYKKIMFSTGKDICQGCLLSTYLFNLYAEYIGKIGLDSEKAMKIGKISIT